MIAPREAPIGPEGGVAVLRGNLAPDGAVIKHTAAERRLLQHAGPAVVFTNYDDLAARIDDPSLPVTADSVLVLQNAGPLGGPGMPEWGMLPIPKKLLQQGVRDMVRISDARMSGTSYGACVLHVAPESFVGGPLALVQDGDIIELDVPARRLSLRVSDEELAQRRAQWTAARGRLPARLRPHVRPSRHAGRQGLRLRLPRRHRPDWGARDTLTSAPSRADGCQKVTKFSKDHKVAFVVFVVFVAFGDEAVARHCYSSAAVLSSPPSRCRRRRAGSGR